MKTLRELADEFNARVPPEKRVRRFASREVAERRLAALPPLSSAPKPARAGSKQAKLIDLLSSPQGATLEEIAAKLAWRRDTARSGIHWDVKQKGYDVRRDGDHYHLVVPDGHDVPAHY